MSNKNILTERYMPISNVIFDSSLIKNDIHGTSIIIARRIYEYIDITSKLTNEEIASLTYFEEDLVRKNVPILLKKLVFINQASKYLRRQLISLFPTWKYCIGKVQHVSIDAQEVKFFFPIPCLDIDGTIIFTDLSKEEFNLLKTINDQKYYLIYYQVIEVPCSFLKISNVIIRATAPSKIIPINELGFNINDQEQPYLIDKDSIIEEKL